MTELDLTRQAAVEELLSSERPRYVIVAASKVGGIHANFTYPADFIACNLQIQMNDIYSGLKVWLSDGLVIFLFWYAVAKIAGPRDNFHPENSHVLPALIRRFHEAKVNGAKEVVVWGAGSPLREFLYVDDLAVACVFLMDSYSGLEHVNVGSGIEVTIKELAELVKEVVGFQGNLVWDKTKPDGNPRKLMDSSRLASMGWTPKVPLRDGLIETYKWYVENVVKQ
ncbi:hypothetical protein FCM35_KLT04954 [Carex littledalei]|uniref:NAD-dependent epimerase/dehydratase domain-containing protein n=1 Tax=Carex littledalei TaxID=544730 RepID=A0A833VNU5_9POAL|nr:hypothetical protein FCM35_KLT04954 [Carex littledalei]